MIVKYCDEGNWVYLDNISKVTQTFEDPQNRIEEYDKKESKRMCSCDYKDPIAFSSDGIKLPDNIIISNKIFDSITDGFRNFEKETQFENLISPSTNNLFIKTLVLETENRNCNVVVLITNQSAFLMNDKGQTIERLN